ncbi:phosphomethylpyrimidine synthase ThiC [uncultured Kocuria sp.]|uniref:phosphomethylpyrimidine synthase ThiC n=1 Tax=uncultured Kocuria sp. TaxID=259305 RepID=UPI00345768D8
MRANANIGDSSVIKAISAETAKLEWAAQRNADSLMHLSRATTSTPRAYGPGAGCSSQPAQCPFTRRW